MCTSVNSAKFYQVMFFFSTLCIFAYSDLQDGREGEFSIVACIPKTGVSAKNRGLIQVGENVTVFWKEKSSGGVYTNGNKARVGDGCF
jgi:hypothetical protein